MTRLCFYGQVPIRPYLFDVFGSNILQAIDSEVNKDTPEETAATVSPQPTAGSQELNNEIKSHRAENDTLGGQLSFKI